jgi:hypothetical protein
VPVAASAAGSQVLAAFTQVGVGELVEGTRHAGQLVVHRIDGTETGGDPPDHAVLQLAIGQHHPLSLEDARHRFAAGDDAVQELVDL